MELKEDGLGSPPKEVQEKSPAGGLGVSPAFRKSPESPFGKGGFEGPRGLTGFMDIKFSDSNSERRSSK
jgi:hypothetical protein